ncbi:DUF4259 domain-containing protein [Luteimonas sp. SJ-92]|uniref:DUF4259 domain-containing protein n=1 Tax=Luteimonas salinisoli TaxID=2752307 RepID=A0A853JB03_9GAMM|nr:DUF4259 domain-containing protein [Luteimonas salinisoli]NZA25818.1 DUF4259 domain-containing protein [Luteimonas salinisoli]
MGTWANDSFGNDDAADWLDELTDRNDLGLVRETVARVLTAEGYLEAPDAAEALAACEVLAAARGRPTAAAQDEDALMDWLARVEPVVDDALVAQAVQAIDRILGADSELRELWEESGGLEDWQGEVRALRGNLVG